MMALALVLLPLAFAALALAAPDRARPWLLPVAGAAQLALVGAALARPGRVAAGHWLVLDSLGKLVLGFVTVLFFLASVYAPGYLAQRRERKNRFFCACLLAFLAMMSLISESHHLGLMWVALEANTLASAPLIYFNKNARSIEATWKYLVVGSVGVAVALLGSFFLAYSSLRSGFESSLLLDDLVRDAGQLSRPWLHSAFILLFVGYGTKMGLAPMHTWKPDAYGEAPGLVGTLMAGGLTSVAFLAVLRFYQICGAAGEAAFARHLMIAIGLLSMAVAAAFLARQRDYKRMLAYSSVEHMGILVLGVGLGGAGVFGALLHLVNNGLAKGVLFLSAGNLHRAYGSKLTDDVRGALSRVPLSAALFLAGFFAITGSPPFGPFLSELTILRAAISGGRFVIAGLFLLLLVVVFIGMGSTVVTVVQGEPPARAPRLGETALTVAPIVVCLLLVTVLGVYIPAPLGALLHEAAALVGGGS